MTVALEKACIDANIRGIRLVISRIEAQIAKRYGNSKNVKALRILRDIRASLKELGPAITQLEKELKHG